VTDRPADDLQRTEAPGMAAPSGPPDAGAATPVKTVAENAWGRVAEDGTVYVRTATGEQVVGSWHTADPNEALAFYGRRYDDLVVQVDLVEKRLESGSASPDDALTVARRVREALVEPQVIGDLEGLTTRVEALEQTVARHREERRRLRAEALEKARTAKEAIAAEAEQIAEGTDWRRGADRLRALLDQWKSLPRLDRATDDVLWRRFSTARTHYTRRRKAHFSEVGERREEARLAKEALVAEAESLAGSTDWNETARKFRDLMTRWKAAGGAPRGIEDQLWGRFRAAQDTFFTARTQALAHRETQFQGNLAAKEALLAEAEALVPVKDWKTARATLRRIQDRWEAVGRVPREAVRGLEARLRRVEEAIRAAERSEWQRTNPAARARAQATVDQLRDSIMELESRLMALQQGGDQQAARDVETALEARRAWLAEAERALEEFR
jgi:soluble cytochrome b562